MVGQRFSDFVPIQACGNWGDGDAFDIFPPGKTHLVIVMRAVRPAIDWFFGCCVDGSDILFSRYNKVDLRVHRPVAGIFIRLSCRDVQRCQALLGAFTFSRAIRKVCDTARPI